MAVSLERIYRFSAGHLYRRPEWSDAENERQFGRCSWPPGHGHNYRLTVTVGGAVDGRTGFVVDLALLDRLVRERVVERLDHRMLQEAIPEFRADGGGKIPSGENLALWIRDELRDHLPPGVRLLAIRVGEDDDLAATWVREAGEPE